MARHDVLPVTPWAARPERSQTLYHLARVRCGAQGLAGAPNKVEPLLFSVEAVQEQLCRPIGNGPVLERVIIPVRASHVPNPSHPLVTRVRQATRGGAAFVRLGNTVQVRLYRTALRLE
jgi:hypothetical protein